MLGDEDEAQDALQEVFARVVEKHPSFRGEAPLLHWLYRITTNLCLNRIRQRRRRPLRAHPAALDLLAVGDEASQVDLLAIRDVLARVDRSTQVIAVHYYLDEMSMEVVAELVGTSRKTVGKRLARFRQRALALLGDRPSDRRGGGA